MLNKIWYAIFDSRYNYDPDRAFILDTSDDLDGAWEAAELHGQGNVVVQMEDRPDGISYPVTEYFSRGGAGRAAQQPASDGGTFDTGEHEERLQDEENDRKA